MHLSANFPGWFLIVGTASLIMLLVFFFLLFLQNSRKQLHHLNKVNELQKTYEHTLLQSQLEIQEQTFKNISQEIHDNIGQVLSLAKLNINTMPDCDSKDLSEKINDTRELITKAIQDLRDLSKSLNADFVTDMGLIKSIEYELDLIKKIGGLRTNIAIEGVMNIIPPQKELILFRIVQEVLNNIIKHAKASLVDVLVRFENQKFLLEIKDNGEGFNIADIHTNRNQKHGMGIRNMENRSNIIGAKFNIESEAGKGTRVSITLPL